MRKPTCWWSSLRAAQMVRRPGNAQNLVDDGGAGSSECGSHVILLAALTVLVGSSAFMHNARSVSAAEPSAGPTIEAGQLHSLVVKPDGTLWAFGNNGYGQLGTTADLGKPLATPTKAMSGVSAVAAGWAHSLALKIDGSLWTFGDNRAGQLGKATNTATAAPNPVPTQAMTDVIAVAAGDLFSLVVKSDGTLWTFGDNSRGQLGRKTNIGTDVANPTPTQVMTDVIAIAAGALHSLVLKTDGTLWTFGDNNRGQLGNTVNSGAKAANPMPVQVMTGVIGIAAGDAHSLALKADGTLWAFGDNSRGQLGTVTNDGTEAANPMPTQVMAGVIAIAAGDVHSLALKADGTLWTFGDNYKGQLGTNTSNGTDATSTPVQVMTGVIGIAAGGSHSLVTESDGTLWTFGDNYNGQLGTAENVGVDVANPMPMTALSEGVVVAAGTTSAPTSEPTGPDITDEGGSSLITVVTVPFEASGGGVGGGGKGLGPVGWVLGSAAAVVVAAGLTLRSRRRRT